MVLEQCTLLKQRIFIKVLDSTMKLQALVLGTLKVKNHVTILVNGRVAFLMVTVFFILGITRLIQGDFIKEKLMIQRANIYFLMVIGCQISYIFW